MYNNPFNTFTVHTLMSAKVAQIIKVWLSVPPRILVNFDLSKSPHFHQRPFYLTKTVKFHTIFIF